LLVEATVRACIALFQFGKSTFASTAKPHA